MLIYFFLLSSFSILYNMPVIVIVTLLDISRHITSILDDHLESPLITIPNEIASNHDLITNPLSP